MALNSASFKCIMNFSSPSPNLRISSASYDHIVIMVKDNSQLPPTYLLLAGLDDGGLLVVCNLATAAAGSLKSLDNG